MSLDSLNSTQDKRHSRSEEETHWSRKSNLETKLLFLVIRIKNRVKLWHDNRVVKYFSLKVLGPSRNPEIFVVFVDVNCKQNRKIRVKLKNIRQIDYP